MDEIDCMDLKHRKVDKKSFERCIEFLCHRCMRFQLSSYEAWTWALFGFSWVIY